MNIIAQGKTQKDPELAHWICLYAVASDDQLVSITNAAMLAHWGKGTRRGTR